MTDESLYAEREQTLVKHLILKRYLQGFARIIGSRWDSLTYVDCFSGPWESRSDAYDDTSFAIAIRELRSAREDLKTRGKHILLRCYFLEKDPAAFARLDAFAAQHGDIEIQRRNAKLEDSVDDIVAFVRSSAASTFPFVFIDPTGWTGFALPSIRPLLKLRPGEVLINFMIQHIVRFVESPDPETRRSFDELFGSSEFRSVLNGLAGLDREDACAEQYTEMVRKAGTFNYSSRAVVLTPLKDRSHFHLIYLTRDLKGVKVFKDAEKKSMEDMNQARAKAQQNQRRKRTGQRELFAAEDVHDASHFEDLRGRYLVRAKEKVLRLAESGKPVEYDDAWATALSEPLVWESDLKMWIGKWMSQSMVKLEGLGSRQRVPKLGQGIRLIPGSP